MTNFNGTSLLAGSTKVSSDVNGVGAYTTANASAVKNQIGEGFDSINFASNFNATALAPAVGREARWCSTTMRPAKT